jgi:DNA-binding NarL/FixJ family response regulator
MASARPLSAMGCRRPRRSWPRSRTARSILSPFLEAHDPRVIVYDLPCPFERHWNFLRLLRQADARRKRIWILTTTDKKALDAAVGASGVVEIVFGEPYSVGEVVDAVRHALPDGRPSRPERRRT